MKTTFDYNFGYIKLLNMHGYTIHEHEKKRSCQLKSFFLNSCKVIIQEKPVNIKNLNKEMSSLY